MIEMFHELRTGSFKLAAGNESSQSEYIRVVKAMSFDSNSHFLDIGSGLGKCVLHVVMGTGCRGTGMEIVANRIKYAKKFLKRLLDTKKVP